MARRGKRVTGRNALALLGAFVAVFLLIFNAAAQEPAPDPARECAEMQKAADEYAQETVQLKRTLSFKTNSGYWRSASEELSFGIARRKIASDLQAIAFKLGVKRPREWSMATLEEKLNYQRSVSAVLESEKGKAMAANQAALEARITEIEAQLKKISLRNRDLGCADLPKDEPCVVPNVAGTYSTTGDPVGIMVLVQDGTRVTGKYGKDQNSLLSTLEGELKCGVLTGTFMNTIYAITGKFTYTFTEDGMSYSGIWRNDARDGSGEINGRRK
jgi:hypothetical protein